MEKTKIMAVALALGMAVSLTACNADFGGNGGSSATETIQSETTAETTAEETTTSEVTTTTTATEATTTTTEETTASAEESATSSETTAAETRVKPEDKVGKKYVDFDDMHFYINGEKYTLGKTTLREMIDDGVPFNEYDLAESDSIVKADHLSQPIRIMLSDDWVALISTINDTDDDKRTDELVIGKLELSNKKDQKQDILTFDFPLDFTMKDLVDVEGVPKDEKGSLEGYTDLDKNEVHATFTYIKTSEKYVGNSSYIFAFIDNFCENITVEFRP